MPVTDGTLRPTLAQAVYTLSEEIGQSEYIVRAGEAEKAMCEMWGSAQWIYSVCS